VREKGRNWGTQPPAADGLALPDPVAPRGRSSIASTPRPGRSAGRLRARLPQGTRSSRRTWGPSTRRGPGRGRGCGRRARPCYRPMSSTMGGAMGRRGPGPLPTEGRCLRGTLRAGRANPDEPVLPAPANLDPPDTLRGKGRAEHRRPWIAAQVAIAWSLRTLAQSCF
jgi:hypothetical protein